MYVYALRGCPPIQTLLIFVNIFGDNVICSVILQNVESWYAQIPTPSSLLIPNHPCIPLFLQTYPKKSVLYS